MNPNDVGLYGLFDVVDGEFSTGFDTFVNDEAASIGFAKTMAFSNVVEAEFQMYRIGTINMKTGEIMPCPRFLIEKNEEVYERAKVALNSKKDSKESPEKVEAKNE